jgi:AbiTii
MSLIHDIQAAAIAQHSDIPTLLRMCKLLAARISHSEFAEWVDRELNGYPRVEDLPDYRVVRVASYGSFIGSFSRADKLQIPLSILPKDLREPFSYAYMGSSISAYTDLVSNNKSDAVQEAWPVSLAVHHASKLTPDMQCVSAWKEIPIGAIVRLMDSVKTRVLGFAIDLEREAPDAGELPIGSAPPLTREKMTQIFNTNINGNVGNIANASTGVNQSSTQAIEAGDWQALQRRLSELGIRPEEEEGLRDDLDRARTSTVPDQKTATLTTWLGRLVGKAASGATGVGIELASAGIAKALAIYLGIGGGA